MEPAKFSAFWKTVDVLAPVQGGVVTEVPEFYLAQAFFGLNWRNLDTLNFKIEVPIVYKHIGSTELGQH